MKPTKGFRFATAIAGIKKPAAPDMALIVSDVEANAAATFTTNRVKAAHVRLGMAKMRSGRAQAVVVTSGNANACTGQPGQQDATELTTLAGRALGLPEPRVLICCTGVIGVRLPVAKMRPKLKAMARALGTASIKDAAAAIMTTDTYPKQVSRTIKIGKYTATISAIAKGAGMIQPNMATMLAFIMTDLAVERRALKSALKNAVEHSFNRITVDGERSTNDTALIMANGMAGNPELKAGTAGFRKFSAVLSEVAYELSSLIAADGEGATKLIEVEIKGALNQADARRAAFKVANSLLVKTALYGADPNWGRVMVALGAAGVSMQEEKTDVSLAGVLLVRRGVSTGLEQKARRAMKKKNITISVNLWQGKATAKVLTCDITEHFVTFNSAYTS